MHAPSAGPITAQAVSPMPAPPPVPPPYPVWVAPCLTRHTNRHRAGRTHRLHAVAVTKALVAILLVAMALVGGCTTSPPSTNPDSPLPQPADTARNDAPTRQSGAETSAPVDTPGVDTPQAVAIQWLSAYHSATWTDPGPASWIDRVRPYVTDAMHTRNTALRDGGAGTDWTGFVDQRCESSVSELAAVIPAEAPGTVTAANVLVTGTVSTTCAAGPARPGEQAAATLVVIKTAAGWRVDQRLF
jgi:hypothetical protein